MGVAAAQRSSRVTGPVVLRYQRPAAGGDSTASPVKGRVEGSVKIAPHRAISVEILAGGRHNRRLLCVEGGNLRNNKFSPRYIVFQARLVGLYITWTKMFATCKRYHAFPLELDCHVDLLERPWRERFSGAERVPAGKMDQDEGRFLSGREELVCHSAVRDGREKLHRSQTRGNADVPHVGAGESLRQ